MRLILEFSPYIFIPLFVALFFKKLRITQISWTYTATTLLVIFYPFLFFGINDLLNPPPPGFRCGMPEAGFFVGSLIILWPISLIIQLVFNRIFLSYKKSADDFDKGILKEQETN